MSTIPDPATTDWVPLQGRPSGMAYFGQWQTGHAYQDGDCVIGADGILYACVVDGTTTAPAAWPGAAGPAGPAGPQGPQGVGVPMPVVEGQWLKGVGGAAVWSALPAIGVGGYASTFSGPWVASPYPSPAPAGGLTATLATSGRYLIVSMATMYTTVQGGMWWDVFVDTVYVGSGAKFFNEVSSHQLLSPMIAVKDLAAGNHAIYHAARGGGFASGVDDYASTWLVRIGPVGGPT